MSRNTAMRLWRRRGGVAGAALLLAALGWAAPSTAALLSDLTSPPSGRVYGVSEVSSGLAHDPARWLGATLRVQGVMTGAQQRRDVHGGWESVGPSRLADPANMTVDIPLTMTTDLPVSWGAPNSLLSWLRRLPLLGGALPRPQTVQWDRLATYRVRLRVVPGRACPRCYEAVLLDAA